MWVGPSSYIVSLVIQAIPLWTSGIKISNIHCNCGRAIININDCFLQPLFEQKKLANALTWGTIQNCYFISIWFILFHAQKFKIYTYIHIHTQTHAHMQAYAYICVYTVHAYARVHIYIIIYISTAILGENRTCRRLRILSSSPENVLK